MQLQHLCSSRPCISRPYCKSNDVLRKTTTLMLWYFLDFFSLKKATIHYILLTVWKSAANKTKSSSINWLNCATRLYIAFLRIISVPMIHLVLIQKEYNGQQKFLKLDTNIFRLFPIISISQKIFSIFFPHTGKNRNRRKSNLLP